MQLLDPNDPFFIPIWRRWVTILVPALWAGFELWGGNSGWAFFFAAASAFAFWKLIIQGPDKAA